MAQVMDVQCLDKCVKALASFEYSIENDFGKGCLAAIENCGITGDGTQQAQAIQAIVDNAKTQIKSIAEFIAVIKESVSNVAADMEVFDMDKRFQDAADTFTKAPEIQGKKKALNL